LPTLTDPARELTDLFTSIGQAGNKTGADHIANIIGVAAWSADFHEVIASIITRMALVKGLVASLGMDDDIQEITLAHIDGLQTAFDGPSLSGRWDQRGGVFLSVANIAAVRSLIPSIRAKMQYPKLSAEEVAEVIDLIDDLEGWLAEHQLVEQDFIRQIIIDGLRQFKFRLGRLHWLGWGYTVQSLRDVIKRVSETTGIVRGHVENAGLMLKVYGAYALATSSHPTIAGLITAVTK
jgi:hypothetical protein